MKETQFLDMWNLKPIKDMKTFKQQNVGCTSTKKILFMGHHLTELLNVHATKKVLNRGEVSLFNKRCAELGRCSYWHFTFFKIRAKVWKGIINIFTKYNFNYSYVISKKMKIAKRKGWLKPIHNYHAIIYSPKFIPLTHICPMFHFWNPRKHKKTLSFSCVFGGSKNVTLGRYGIR